jgi:L-xylulokinase
MSYLMGIDSGLTVTKAVVFDDQGRTLGVSASASKQETPRPRWVERDMDDLWASTQTAIRQALDRAGVTGSEVTGIGVSGHGDGIYLIDEAGRPTRPGINSMDSRAQDVLARWSAEGLPDRALEVLGTDIWAGLPATLITWVREHEPEAYRRTRWNLACKDWIRYKLTGEIATDPTEASSGFTEVRSQRYSPEVFRLLGLEDFADKVPPIVGSDQVAGQITSEAAAATGLAEGTPVVTGAHDIDCCAVGVGIIAPGEICAITGTWSINEMVYHEPIVDPRWACRNFVRPGSWLYQSSSPASSANLEWFVRQLCRAEVAEAEQQDESPFAFVGPEVASVQDQDSHMFFHPFIYGAPGNAPNAAAFLGLRGWHQRAHMLRALFEGVMFNHLTHINTLREGFEIRDIRLTGGGSRSDVWCQMYADALGVPVQVTDADESGALGTAMLAGVGTGIYDSLEDAVKQTVRLAHTYEPDKTRGARLLEAYQTWTATVEALAPVSSRLG